MRDCWRKRIPETWNDRGFPYPKDVPIEELIIVPQNAQYYAAFGSVMYGMHEAADVGRFIGIDKLTDWIHRPDASRGSGHGGGSPLLRAPSVDEKHAELEAFREQYRIPKFKRSSLNRDRKSAA